MLYLPAFSESNAWDFQLAMTNISGNDPTISEDFQRITKDFRTLPKIKCPRADVPLRRLSTFEAT